MKPKFKDPRGRHCRLYGDIQTHPAWLALTWFEKCLWLAMRRRLGSTNNGNIEATLGGEQGLRHDGIRSSASLASGLRALEAVGLIAKTRQGQLSQGKKICNLFRFTDESTEEIPKIGLPRTPPTRDWLRFTSIAQAEAAIRAAHAAAKTGRKPGKNKPSVQLMTASSSGAETVGGNINSSSEAGVGSPIRQLKVVKTR